MTNADSSSQFQVLVSYLALLKLIWTSVFHFTSLQVMTSLMLVCHWVTDGEKNFWIIWNWNDMCPRNYIAIKQYASLQSTTSLQKYCLFPSPLVLHPWFPEGWNTKSEKIEEEGHWGRKKLPNIYLVVYLICVSYISDLVSSDICI